MLIVRAFFRITLVESRQYMNTRGIVPRHSERE
jgi:hypothetical protein